VSTLTVPFTFSGGTFAVASQVNSNFTTLYGWVNTNAIWADASRSFTGIPSGPSADPTSANQLARKSYVDQRVLMNQTPGAANHILKWGLTNIPTNGGNIVFPTAFPNVCEAFVAVPFFSSGGAIDVTVVSKATNACAVRIYNGATGAAFPAACDVLWFAGGY
jgi:hypothetical protein